MRHRTPAGLPLRQRIEFHSMPVTECGCWIWMATSYRYGGIKVDGLMLKAHRASYQAFKGPIPDGLNVLHQCDITECVNPDHLFLGTQLDNVHDMEAKGRGHKRGLIGRENPMAKIGEDEVRAIRLSTESESRTAAKFGIARTTVHAIRHRVIWKHIL